jgi:hypothetical protein
MKLLICLTAFAMSLASAAPVDRPWTHYNELLGMLKMDKFYATPLAQRDKVIMLGGIVPNDPSIARKDVVFTIMDGADRKRIPVNADGSFEIPFNPAWVKSDPEVWTTIPAGQKSKFGFNAVPVKPHSTQLDYASLMGGVPQVNAIIKAQAGMLRFMLPTLVGITLHFPKESHATVALGETRVAADANGLVMLRLDKALLAANVPVTLSELPIKTGFLED